MPVIAAVNLVEPESSDELSSTEGVLVIDITQGEHSHHSNSDSDTVDYTENFDDISD